MSENEIELPLSIPISKPHIQENYEFLLRRRISVEKEIKEFERVMEYYNIPRKVNES